MSAVPLRRSLFPHAAEGVTFRRAEEGTLVVETPANDFGYRGLPPEVLTSIDAMAPERSLAQAEEGLDTASLALLHQQLGHLFRRLALVVGIGTEAGLVATLEPSSPRVRFPRAVAPPSGPQILSRFASLRRDGVRLVLESPRAHARLHIHREEVMTLLAGLAEPCDLARLASTGAPGTGALLEVLRSSGFLTASTQDGETAEDADLSLGAWEFHDLQFHNRSRLGRHSFPMGGVYPFPETPPPPALKELPAGPRIPLPAPDHALLARRDPPLSAVVEARRSIRDYGDEPLSLSGLAEFLFRVARVTRRRTAEVQIHGTPLEMEFAHRPYPSGGALYEMEFYVAVSRCRDLEPGLYYYAPAEHGLVRIEEDRTKLGALLKDASRCTGIPVDRLQVEIVLAARFRRMAWKYRGMTYAAILKHVGGIYEAMYLAATAMGLAPCALGIGNPDLLADLTGTDPCEEGSVGEFLLGSRGPD